MRTSFALCALLLPAAAFISPSRGNGLLSKRLALPIDVCHSRKSVGIESGRKVARIGKESEKLQRTSTAMAVNSVAAVIGAVLLIGGVDSTFRLILRGVSPLPAALVVAQLAAAVGLLIEGFTLPTSSAVAIVAAALFQGADMAGGAEARRKAFSGKTVWITGASSGIGEAMSYEFFAAGAQVILSARRLSELERVRDECLRKQKADFEGYNAVPSPIIVPLDLSKPEEMSAAVATVKEAMGKEFVDIVVHNGGVSTRALAEDMSWEVDESVLKVNYLGPVALTKALLPSMLARGKGGHLVAISSVQGIIGLPARTAYSASKHAMHGFFDGLRAELASRNVAVSLICPGYVRTALSLNAVNAKGEKYGVMDDATNKGMPPEKFAALALDAIARKDAQIVIADDVSAHVGVYIKRLAPHLLEWIMRNRAKKAA